MTSLAGSPPNGLILVLNNCEDRLQLVLGHGHELLASRELSVPRRTVQFMVPAVSEMLAEQERGPEEIIRIAVTRGPGSFTGIRLALSASFGIAAGNNALLAGLDYLPLVAAAPLALSPLPVMALTYARRGQVYLQGFEPNATPMRALQQLRAEDAKEQISKLDQGCVVVGTGLHKNYETFAPLADSEHLLLGEQWSHPKPDSLLLAANNATYSNSDIEPAYGRNADAEDNLDAIATKRGIDPAQARRILQRSRGN